MLGSPVSVSHGANRRLLVYKHCIPLCESGDLQTEVASDIIGLLMLEVSYLPYRTQINSNALVIILAEPVGSNPTWRTEPVVKVFSKLFIIYS